MNIANQGFPATRADLNNALQAIATNNSGTSAPSTTFANQWWYDESNNKLYIRNEANNAWIQVAVLDQTNNEWQITTGVIQAKDGDGLALKTDDGTTRLFVKDDGNVGIGITPRAKVDIFGTGTGQEARVLIEGEGGADPYVNFLANNTTHFSIGIDDSDSDKFKISKNSALGTNDSFAINTSAQVGIGFGNPDTTLHVDCGAPSSADKTIAKFQSQSSRQIGFVWDDSKSTLGIATLTNHALAFHANGNSNEHMRISSGGDVIFGGGAAVPSSSAGGAAFDPNSNGRSVLKLGTSSTGNQGLAEFFNPNGQVGGIVVNGSATSYNTSSDYRLKENVTDVTDGITRLKKLSPKRFNFIADADTTVDGFIAHEAATVIPEAVSGDKDAMMDEEYEVKAAVTDDDGDVVEEAEMGTRSVPDYQGIDQSKLVPLLTAALQEAIAKIEALETRVATLEG